MGFGRQQGGLGDRKHDQKELGKHYKQEEHKEPKEGKDKKDQKTPYRKRITGKQEDHSKWEEQYKQKDQEAYGNNGQNGTNHALFRQLKTVKTVADC